MRLIGVVDLAAGRAVRAHAGLREQYQPVCDVAGSRLEPGDAVGLARAYVDRLGIAELYVADLDAIVRGSAPHSIVGALASLGAPLWLDSGVSTVNRARQAVDAGASRVVVGLETLEQYQDLGQISDAVGAQSVAFSLDLRNGLPVTRPGFDGNLARAPEQIARRAADCGVAALIVLDLARVGTGSGLDFDLLSRIRRSVPEVMLVVGGGVRGTDDLRRLADGGCDAALVATALQRGWLTADG